MKTIFLSLLMAVAVNFALAEKPPATYQQMKSEFKNLPAERELQFNYIKTQMVIGAATGAVIFAANEYFVWNRNEMFHTMMPWVAVIYTAYQTFNLVMCKVLEPDHSVKPPLQKEKLTILRF